MPPSLDDLSNLPLETFAGAATTLGAHLRPGPAVISFWASWCAPCVEEAGYLSTIRHRYGADRLNMIGLNVELSPTRALRSAFWPKRIASHAIARRRNHVPSLRRRRATQSAASFHLRRHRPAFDAYAAMNVQATNRAIASRTSCLRGFVLRAASALAGNSVSAATLLPASQAGEGAGSPRRASTFGARMRTESATERPCAGFINRDIRDTPARGRRARALAAGDVRLKLDLFALTSNNVTYAAMGEGMLGYWDFFPAPEGFGKVPVWGFGTVIQSNAPEIAVGARFYGYYPLAETLDVTPRNARLHRHSATPRDKGRALQRLHRHQRDPGYV
jgi:thiol-disulfide isomerase/thioredoxin